MEIRFEISTDKKDLGRIKTGHPYSLDKFDTQDFIIRVTDTRTGKKNDSKVNAVERIEAALAYIGTHCAHNESCNEYFRSLNTRQPISLEEILQTKKLLIHRIDPGKDQDESDVPQGYCEGWGADWARIGLSFMAFRSQRLTSATLLHELAHVAGAPGKSDDPNSIAAETALKHCGMTTLFNKNATGRLDQSGTSKTLIA